MTVLFGNIWCRWHALHLVHCQKCRMKVCIICWNKAQLIAPLPSFLPSIILLRRGNHLECYIHVWCDQAYVWGKQPGHYCGIGVILHYAANIFSYETAKNKAKDENCMVSTSCRNGPHNKVKHKFPRRMFPGHLISPLDNLPRPVRYPHLSETLISVCHLKSKVYATPPTACKKQKSTLWRNVEQLTVLYCSELCRTLDNSYSNVLNAMDVIWIKSSSKKVLLLNCIHCAGHSLKHFIAFVVPSLTSLQKSHMHTPHPVQGVFSN
jgi:hypothetical protein